MSSVKLCCFVGILLQILVNTNAKPFGFGCGEQFYPPPCEPECGPPPAIIPIPQPVPVRIPHPQRPSVTIPNIILALLPPNNKPVVPRPIFRPPPVVLPLPQPLPYPVPTEFGCEGFGGFGGFGGFKGLGGFRGCGC